MNQLGTACKKFIEKPRQELRISIALSRKPVFSKDPSPEDNIIDTKSLVTPELEALKRNIVDQQLFIIDECTKVYRFIDYLHDRRKVVKLKNVGYQPQINIYNALLYKMKADYLRYIFECLDGDDGLLRNEIQFTEGGKLLTLEKEAFDDDIEERMAKEIGDDKKISCLFCNPEEKDDTNMKPHPVETFYREPRTLIDYFKHEVYHEYERAKLEIFDRDFNSYSIPKRDGINDHDMTPFHPVYMSSLMNQQVFRREVMVYEQKIKEYKLEVAIQKQKEQQNQICEEDGDHEEHNHVENE